MDTLNNARKAFAPLGERLHFFETGLHLLPNNDHDIEVNQHDYFYPAMIDKVGRDANSYDVKEVYKIAYEYLFRANRVNELLEGQKGDNRDIKATKWEMWNSEIHEYLNQLLAILQAREEACQTYADTNIVVQHIQLPENYTITQLHAHFKPKYQHSTIALLMYYMSKVGILPPYEQREFGKIAPIFGFHDKTIAKDIRNVNPESKSDLKKVLEVAENLLAAISSDLTKASKR